MDPALVCGMDSDTPEVIRGDDSSAQVAQVVIIV